MSENPKANPDWRESAQPYAAQLAVENVGAQPEGEAALQASTRLLDG